jgi:hypothetical protein
MSPRASARPVAPSEDGIPPDRAPDSRGVPAGLVLVAGLVALLFGALLNADAMAKRAETQPFCTGDEILCTRDLKIDLFWHPLQSVSDALGFNTPRQRLDAFTGNQGSTTDERDVDDLNAGRRGASDERAAGDGDQATTTTAVPDPEIRTPTAEEPLRVWIGGDSIVQTFGASMQRVAASTGVMDAALDYRVSTGLTRPDYFNWPAHLVDNVLVNDPELVVIMFGANDSQAIELDDGTVLPRFDQAWLDEYRRRVAGTMDLLADPDNDRQVIWVGQPIMGPGSGVKGMEKLNHIYWDEARTRPWITYFDSWPFFADANGNYADDLPAIDGSVSGMRQADDVHLSTKGGDRLSWAILRRLDQLMDLTNSTAVEDGATAPPTEVAERDDVPPAAPEIVN